MPQAQTNSQKSPQGQVAGKEAHSAEIQNKGARRPSAASRRPAVSKANVITDEQRHALIAEEAYLIAERRGFEGDCALDDWLQAEAEIDARLAGG